MEVKESSGEAAELRKRARQLRDCAREARALAGRLGPYLDDAVKRATPRASSLWSGGDAAVIWQGPFADQCTTVLQNHRQSLNGMGGALQADATRWENQAAELDKQATAKDKAEAATGGNR
ncbi:hypothetical protein ACFWUQ_16085 [Streptomyces sp. NPDC058662]|uniref:hypothetical protein n=1 Tax=Streptomyces sp. NPDC058662 TaxID=3346583 RepID=UPI00364DD550